LLRGIPIARKDPRESCKADKNVNPAKKVDNIKSGRAFWKKPNESGGFKRQNREKKRGGNLNRD